MMLRRGFLGAFLCVGSWLGLNTSAGAQGPVRRSFGRMRDQLFGDDAIMNGNRLVPEQQGVIYADGRCETDAAAVQRNRDRRFFNAARTNMRQVVGFTIWIMLLIWAIQMIIEWFIRNGMSLTADDRKRVGHFLAECGRFEGLATECGCRAYYDEGVAKEARS